MKHEKFVYHDYSITEQGFSYRFSMDEYEFRPTWSLNLPVSVNESDPVLRELVFNLGMVELVSYWKSACPQVVEVSCGSLDSWQVEWWKKLYLNGLGEFFYVNEIVPQSDFMTIISAAQTSANIGVQPLARTLSGSLIPVGGGKDSIVTLELLKQLGGFEVKDNFCYIVGDIKRAYDSAKTAGYNDSQIISVKRTIDPQLLELNKKGYLNGHTPFSAVIAFSSLIFAYLLGKKYIVLSNESSANEGNNCQLSTVNSQLSVNSQLFVNHQYSKSTEFERDFREYTEKTASKLNQSLPEYFSLLRPWNELQITREFSLKPQYFSVFQSCNAGTKSNTWCCKCAKCLYVYIMLSAFLDEDTLVGIFGENLLKNPQLEPILTALVDPSRNKPFECVGTREEVNAALDFAKNKSNPDFEKLMNSFDDDNFVPDEFIGLLN